MCRHCWETVGSDDNGHRFHDADELKEEKHVERGVDGARKRLDKTTTAVDSTMPTSSRRRSAWSRESTVS